MTINQRTISASEIGSYLYCQRSWGYQRQGIESANIEELAQGSRFHQQHGRQFQASRRLRFLAGLILVVAISALLTQFLA